MARYCRKCGNKIPRKYVNDSGNSKKTSRDRKYCYVCRPITSEISERKRRKELLVKMLGGHCIRCGYSKCIEALSFHHKNQSEKSFDISHNGGILNDWDMVVKEAKKCELLCLNCHSETHNH